VIDVSEWTGESLDYAVEQALLGEQPGPTCDVYIKPPPYSTDWRYGGPIIERERISVWYDELLVDVGGPWHAAIELMVTPSGDLEGEYQHSGPTPLIAAMRAFVASNSADSNKP
jgi:hypothetical protein